VPQSDVSVLKVRRSSKVRAKCGFAAFDDQSARWSINRWAILFLPLLEKVFRRHKLVLLH